MEFPEPIGLRKENEAILSATNVTFGYLPKKLLLKNVSVVVRPEHRIGILGANGVGKSTLLKLLLGQLDPLSGLVERNRNARISLFAQHHMDHLDLKQSPLDFLREKFADDIKTETNNSAQFVRQRLGTFGISLDA
eukprot:GABV01006657.1.p1 GENE.GABV01006657.1~~GABV01006657.1.p1  ORF type:complete len:136 (-),score=47.81 GABV01006657.1:3-410(-)